MTNGVTIQRPDPKELEQEVIVFAPKNIIQVVDKESSAKALVRYADAGRMIKKIDERFEPTRKAFDLAKKELLALRDGIKAPLEMYRNSQIRMVNDYNEKTDAAERAERLRLQKEAEDAEELRKEMDAGMAEDAGDVHQAEAIRAEPVVVPEIVVETQVAEVEGVSKQKKWHAEETDKVAALREIVKRIDAGDLGWAAYADLNMPAFNRLAVSMRENLKFPGIEPKYKIIHSVR